jgi:hypothetical protein
MSETPCKDLMHILAIRTSDKRAFTEILDNSGIRWREVKALAMVDPLGPGMAYIHLLQDERLPWVTPELRNKIRAEAGLGPA